MNDGGAGVVVTRGSVEVPEVIEEFCLAAGRATSSFQAEIVALEAALDRLERWGGEWGRVMIVTDSQAALEGIRSARGKRVEERVSSVLERLTRLSRAGKQVILAWAPSHCGIVGNERADRMAGEGAKKDQGYSGCMWKSVKARWKRRERKREFGHERCREVYGEGIKEVEIEREEEVELARLRSGHSLGLGSYRVRIGVGGSLM